MGNNSGAEWQIIATLAGVMLTGFGVLVGHWVPIWHGQLRRWVRDRDAILREHDRVAADLAGVIKERDELRASLNSASQGSTVSRDLITGLQEQIDEMKRDFTQRLDDAVGYILELTQHIVNGDTGPLPEPPASLTDELRERIASRKHAD